MDVDIELAKRQSSENPVYYVQYAHARIASILRKAADAGLAAAPSVAGLARRRAEEGTLARVVARLPEVVEDAAAAAGDAGHHHLRHRARDGVPRLLSRRAGRRSGRAGALGEHGWPSWMRRESRSRTPSRCSGSPRRRRCSRLAGEVSLRRARPAASSPASVTTPPRRRRSTTATMSSRTGPGGRPSAASVAPRRRTRRRRSAVSHSVGMRERQAPVRAAQQREPVAAPAAAAAVAGVGRARRPGQPDPEDELAERVLAGLRPARAQRSGRGRRAARRRSAPRGARTCRDGGSARSTSGGSRERGVRPPRSRPRDERRHEGQAVLVREQARSRAGTPAPAGAPRAAAGSSDAPSSWPSSCGVRFVDRPRGLDGDGVALDERQPGERPVALVGGVGAELVEVEVLVLQLVRELVGVRHLLGRPERRRDRLTTNSWFFSGE